MASSPSGGRPPIRDADKQEVRRRCGFGCVICGIPIYHYDHIVEYAQVQQHDPENIVLLCAHHHDLKTRGILPNQHVIDANEQPYNLQAGATTPFTWPRFNKGAEVVLGSDVYRMEGSREGDMFAVFTVDGRTLLGFRNLDGHILFTVAILDEYNLPLLSILDNEMTLRADQWDVTVEGPRLVLRQALRNILIDIRFEAPDRVIIRSGRFLFNGVEIIVRPDHYLVPSGDGYATLRGNVIRESGPIYLFALGVPQPRIAMFSYPRVNRYVQRATPKVPPASPSGPRSVGPIGWGGDAHSGHGAAESSS
jgi:HNH endonuclease